MEFDDPRRVLTAWDNLQMTRLVMRFPGSDDREPRWRPMVRCGAVVAAAVLATACGGSHRAAAPGGSVAPAPAPTSSAAYAATLSGVSANGASAPNDASLWAPGQAACPAGPSSGTTDNRSPGPPSGSGTAASSGRFSAGADSGAGRPAIILRASASAQEVRFASQPRIVVRLCGGTLDSVHVIERRNLPSPVVAGTTYRDVYIAVEILGHLDAACIVSKLGAGGTQPAGPCAGVTLSDSAGARRTAMPPQTSP